MRTPGCLWNRSRLGPYADQALGARAAAAVARHLDRCAPCRRVVNSQQHLRALVRSAAAAPVPAPDWSAFWPSIQRRLAGERPRVQPVRDPWWLPVWKPFWGHPRVAVAGAVTGVLALALTLQPFGPSSPPPVGANPVEVQDATTADPDASVMVYSGADDVTVIWLLHAEAGEPS